MNKNAKNGTFWRFFWKPESCCQTLLPDRSILVGQKLVENAIIEKLKVRHFSTNFGPLKNDLSGNTVDPNLQVSKNRQIAPFLAFLLTFVYSKCKRSSLRSQCWMRLFLWFSNTVISHLSTLSRIRYLKAFSKLVNSLSWIVIGVQVVLWQPKAEKWSNCNLRAGQPFEKCKIYSINAATENWGL